MTKTFTPARPIWCAGCGDFGVQQALESAMKNLNIESHNSMIIAGIGCSGHNESIHELRHTVSSPEEF